jgi:hypothetical protein
MHWLLGADRDSAVSTLAVRWPVRSSSAVISPVVALAMLVWGSAVIRFALALERSAHRYLPDEFLYGQLARSLAEGDGFRVLGQPTRLPSILQPVLSAPAWLTGDPELAFRLTQAMNACAMSLAAVPGYLLGRQIGLGRRASFACAAAAVVSPDLVYAGYVTADAIGYTVALAAALAAVRLLSWPTLARQVSFLAVCGLATAVRVQYAALLPATLVAALVVERGRVRVAARGYWLLGGIAAVGIAIGSFASDPLLGRYASLLASDASWEAGQWFGRSVFLLALACGMVVVPSALVWLGAQLRQPASRPAAAFASLLIGLAGWLLTLSALVGLQSESPRFFERYLMVFVPLVFIAGAAGLTRRTSWRLPAAISIAVAATLALVPLAEFTAGQGPADSPFLLAVTSLEALIGVGSAGLLVALAGTLLALTGLLAATGRIPPACALGGTLALLCVVSVGGHAADIRLSERVSRSVLGSNPGWVDATGLRGILLVHTRGSDPGAAMVTTLRNRAIEGMATLGRSASIEGTGSPLTVGAGGALFRDGRPLSRPLLVISGTSRLVFASARAVARGPNAELYPAARQHRLSAIVEGLTPSGALERTGKVLLYPTGDDRCIALSLVAERGAAVPTVRFRTARGSRRVIASKPTQIAFPVTLGQEVDFAVSDGGRVLATPSLGPCTQTIKLRRNLPISTP